MKEESAKGKNDLEKPLLAWQYPEYQTHDRSPNWFFTVVAVAGFLVVYGILTTNYLFSLIIILASLIVFFQIYRSPENINFAILPHGLTLGDTFYRFQDLNKFWIVYQPPAVKKLYLDFKGWRPKTIVPLEEQDPVQVRDLLKKYVKEDLEIESESLTEQISRWLKL